MKSRTGTSMLVDSRTSSHIVIDESGFCSIDENLNHKTILLSSHGTKHNEFALKRGIVEVCLKNKSGETDTMKLHGVLYIPTFLMDIFCSCSYLR